MTTLSIKDSFSEYTGLRHCNISENSGEEFYHTILNNKFKEAFEKGEQLEVNLDRVDGYASSFLDEAFGKLVFDFTLDKIKDYILIVSEQEPHWKEMIEQKTFPQWESRRIANQVPVVTKIHDPWYRIVNNQLKLERWESPAAM